MNSNTKIESRPRRERVRSERVRYLATSAWRLTFRKFENCPNCGASHPTILKRKYVVTALARCGECNVLYRLPIDPPRFNEAYYQQRYTSDFTTELPDPATLREYKRQNFRNTPKDLRERIELLQALGLARGAKVLDFGASWGYGVYQLLDAGFDATGYEISAPRARFAAENLDVEVATFREDVAGPFDAVTAFHVIEHVPRPSEVFDWIRQVVRPGGLFVAITPNGSDAYARAEPNRYHRHWGKVHPFYLDDRFYRSALSDRPKLLASVPYDLEAISQWDGRSDLTLDLSGWELLCIVAF